MAFEILSQAFIFGVVGGVIPGTVLTMILVSTLHRGFWAGFKVFGWAVFSEMVIVAALLFGAVQLSLSIRDFAFVGLFGGAILIYFAWRVFKLRSVKVEDSPVLFTPSKIFLLSITNAPLYVFWITICFPLIWQLGEEWMLTAAAGSFFILFQIGWGLATGLMLWFFAFSRKVLTNEHVMHKVYIGVAVLLAGFGLRLLVQSVNHYL